MISWQASCLRGKELVKLDFSVCGEKQAVLAALLHFENHLQNKSPSSKQHCRQSFKSALEGPRQVQHSAYPPETD